MPDLPEELFASNSLMRHWGTGVNPGRFCSGGEHLNASLVLSSEPNPGNEPFKRTILE
jgi:hypothetical protein